MKCKSTYKDILKEQSVDKLLNAIFSKEEDMFFLRNEILPSITEALNGSPDFINDLLQDVSAKEYIDKWKKYMQQRIASYPVLYRGMPMFSPKSVINNNYHRSTDESYTELAKMILSYPKGSSFEFSAPKDFLAQHWTGRKGIAYNYADVKKHQDADYNKIKNGIVIQLSSYSKDMILFATRYFKTDEFNHLFGLTSRDLDVSSLEAIYSGQSAHWLYREDEFLLDHSNKPVQVKVIENTYFKYNK